METRVVWESFEQIGVLGIDEIALKRGHRDCVAIVTTPTLNGVEVLAVLKDRTRETVEAFLASIPERLKATIDTVCTDMYIGYVNAARQQLPHTRIVINRFMLLVPIVIAPMPFANKNLNASNKNYLKRNTKHLRD